MTDSIYKKNVRQIVSASFLPAIFQSDQYLTHLQAGDIKKDILWLIMYRVAQKSKPHNK